MTSFFSVSPAIKVFVRRCGAGALRRAVRQGYMSIGVLTQQRQRAKRQFLAVPFKLVSICLLALISACQPFSRADLEQKIASQLDLPSTWEEKFSATEETEPLPNWRAGTQYKQLEGLITSALETNLDIQQKALDLRIARSALNQSKLEFLPTLETSLTAGRRGSDGENASLPARSSASPENSFALSAELRYELNIWGQVSARKKASFYSYASTSAEYAALTRSVAKNLAFVWAGIVENQQLYTLGQSRLGNLRSNLRIIEEGYKSGLNRSLEVYLARNEVEREQTRLLTTRQSVLNTRRELNILLGRYPRAQFDAPNRFPQVEKEAFSILPAALLKQHPRLQQAWYALLRQNEQLAIAHKARFPTFSLSASADRASNDVDNILSDGIVSWSLGARILQPLLNAGRLKDAEMRARLQLKKSENAYIQVVYQTFNEIEAAISQHDVLRQQRQHTLVARDNAVAAEKLSFEQYRLGLVSYTTVLDAQRRAFDAEIQLISIQKQQFINSFNLFVDLLGDRFDDGKNSSLFGPQNERKQ